MAFQKEAQHIFKHSTKILQIMHLNTRYTGSQCYKRDCVDTVLKIDEAAEVTSHVTDNSSTESDEDDGKYESGITVVNG